MAFLLPELTFSNLFLGVAIFGMIGAIGSSGYDAGTNADKLKDQITEINNKTASLKAKYDKIISDQQALDEQIKSDITAEVDQIIVLTAQAKVAQDNFKIYYSRIQTIGVVFIVVIFFLLLLKYTGILDTIF